MHSTVSRLTSTSRTLTFSLALLSAAAPALVSGCGGSPSGSGPSTVTASATAYNRSTHALSLGAIIFVDGIYLGCKGHNGGAWSVNVDGWSGSGPNPPLTVATGDTGCELVLMGYETVGPTYLGLIPFVLNTGYATIELGYSTAPGSVPVSFYANAKMSAGGFGSDFSIDIVYSDDPFDASGPNTATVAVSATADSSQVDSPEYTVQDLTTINVNVDSSGIVTSAAGSFDFSPMNGRVGEDYVIVAGALSGGPPTFAQDDDAFNTANAMTPALSTGPGPEMTITADQLLAPGVQLPAVRTVIFRNINMFDFVPAYESYEIFFNAP